ncbi:hypothetical protein AYX14_04968 [Cryptococcus neoformans]|nr:hypothetical protein AYX14_04968 [Cryptococcus neoformans var. grubii]
MVLLRTRLTIPKSGRKPLTPLLINMLQLSEFAFVRQGADPHTSGPVKWYQGNSYGFGGPAPGLDSTINPAAAGFGRSLLLEPGMYIMLVRAVYDIRQFGDPGPGNPPTIKMSSVNMVHDAETHVTQLPEEMGTFPSVLSGWLMGEWASVGVRVPEGALETTVIGVSSAKVIYKSTGAEALKPVLAVEIVSNISVVPGQTRLIAMRVRQQTPLSQEARTLSISIDFQSGGQTRVLQWSFPLHHVTYDRHSLTTNNPRFWITFASPSLITDSRLNHLPAHVSSAMIVPPKHSVRHDAEKPVILALHGAGVDVKHSEWGERMPEVPGAWAVLPIGKNEWGEDWHGGSMEDAWAARAAAAVLLRKTDITLSDETVIIGHSNGGQGAWHLAARYPDRVIGIIAASGWLTIQHYVPYTDYTSNRYADPALMGILLSSLAPYHNDLHSSNLSDIPILAIHGADDDNVPPRHSRAHAALVSSWAGEKDSSIKVLEIPKRGHWWDDVLSSSDVVDFIQKLPPRQSWDEQRKKGYTLTTANPQECGGRAGIRIVELDTPGRLARLDVNARQWKLNQTAEPLDIRGMNVRRIEIKPLQSSQHFQTYIRCRPHGFSPVNNSVLGPLAPPRAYGPMIRILSSPASFHLVIPSAGEAQPQHLSIAKRIAHDLYVYHKADCEIISDQEGLELVAQGQIGPGSIIVIGRPEDNRYTEWMAAEAKIPIQFPTKGIMVINKDKVVYDRGAGVIALHPHPTHSGSLSLLIAGNDELGLELAARLFPIRTGVPLPDWAIVCPRSRWQGANGLIGAGFWGGEWEYNEAMSWMDR